MKEQTRKEMQQKMVECQMSASEVSWAEIEQAVNARIAGTQQRHTVIMPIRRMRIAAAIIAILVAGGTGFWMLHHQGQTENQQAKQVSTAAENMAEVPAMPTNEPAVYAMPVSSTYHIASTAIPAKRPDTHEMESEENAPAKANTQENGSMQTPEQSTHLQHHSPTTEPHAQTTTHSTAARPATDSRLTAKVYLGNSMNGYEGSTTFTPMLMSANPFGVYDDEMSDNNSTPLYADLPESKTSVRHYQPLRFGLSFRYAIDNRWSVESGLSYSRHKSDITNRSGNRETTTEQRLSYIGIPLSANYRIWSSRHFSIYASTGGMVEKMLKGSRNVQTVTDGNPEKGTTENVSIRPLQFSLGCAAGAEFLVNKAFSLYAEPGLSYHFDNGSSIPTIYQDEPLNLNLSIGLRFSFY